MSDMLLLLLPAGTDRIGQIITSNLCLVSGRDKSIMHGG